MWLHGEASTAIGSGSSVSRNRAWKLRTEELFDDSEFEQAIGLTVKAESGRMKGV